MPVQATLVSRGTRRFLHLQPLRPYRLICSNAAGNSGNEPPNHKRIRRNTPDILAVYTDDYGSQRGRVWLHKTNEFPYDTESVIGPYENYRVYLKTGVFHRAPRDHTASSIFDRFSTTMYGWGKCRSKELNGQILMGDMIVDKVDNPKIHYEYINTRVVEETSCCHTAGYYTSATHDPFYVSCYDLIQTGIIVGKASLLGTDFAYHDFACNGYVKCQVNIPPDAILLEATISIYGAEEAGAAYTRLRLLDTDDCDDFGDDVSCPDNTVTEAYEHALINPWDGLTPADQDLIYVDSPGSGGLVVPLYCADGITRFDIRKLVQKFIDRPGYDVGQYMGVAFIDDALNSVGEFFKIPRQQQTPTITITVRWAESDYDPHAKPPRPPKWMSYEKIYNKNDYMIPPSEEMGENEPSLGTASGMTTQNWGNIFEDFNASNYKYVIIAPVPNIASWYDPELHGPTPLYGPDAHNAPYSLNQCGSYAVPCSKWRSTPYRYGTLGENNWIDPGLRVIVGHADKTQLAALEPMYMEGCAGYEASSIGLTESGIQRYEARTETVRVVFSTLHNWYVEYTIYLRAWLVYGDHQSFLHLPINYPPDSDPDNYGTIIHWNCWYEQHIECKVYGPDKEDPKYDEFVAFVAEQENGFGGTVTPRYAKCNDLLLRCANVKCAMGDIARPPANVQQDDCDDVVEIGRKLPCVEENAISYWYLPELGSNHPVTPAGGPTIPQMPETGLYHEFKRTVFLTPEKDEMDTRTDYGWQQIIFQANHPHIKGGTPIDPFPKNHVMQVTPFSPLTAQLVPDGDYGYVEYEYVDELNKFGLGAGTSFIFAITHGDSAATVESSINTAFGDTVCSVEKDSSDPDVFIIEWIGTLGAYHIDLNLNFYYAEPDGDFESVIVTIIDGSSGGIP